MTRCSSTALRPLILACPSLVHQQTLAFCRPGKRMFGVFCIGILALVCLGCRGSYTNQVVTQEMSPDNQRKAVVFVRRCTDFLGSCPPVTWLSILGANQDLPAGPGNAVAVTGGGFSSDVAKVPGAAYLQIAWHDSQTLIVSDPGPTRFLKRNDRVGPVHVQYRTIGIE
jgi:hypothetical protein